MTNWNENEFYKICKALVTSIKIVNDVTESAVTLMMEYNKLKTASEEQKRYL